MRSETLSLLLLSIAAGACVVFPSLGPAPRLFASGAAPERFDFEDAPLSRLPEGFEPVAGDWAIADSPTAASGQQLLALRSEKPAALAVKDADASREIRGEVTVRVFVGASGAGLACRGDDGGYRASLEPAAGRLALYRQKGDSEELVGSHSTAVKKGSWARVGILCGLGLVAAYLDGEPVIEAEASLSLTDLALQSGPGVLAQFDDLRVATRK